MINYYSCQICQKEIKSSKDLIIIPNIQPLCSDKCREVVYLGVLGEYNNSQIKEAVSFALPKYKPEKRQEAVKKLAVWMLNKKKECVE